MVDRTKIAKAQLVDNLAADETFQEVMAGVVEKQASVMRNPDATPEDLIAAHDIVKGVKGINDYIRSVHNAGAVESKKL